MLILFIYFEQCSNIPEILRFDCHPEDGASQLSCTNRGCCWNPPKNKKMKRMKHVPLNIPYCYYPENWDLYTYDNYSRDDSSFFGFLRQEKKSAYKNDIPLVKIEATNINSSILRVKVHNKYIIKIYQYIPLYTNIYQKYTKIYHFVLYNIIRN